MKWLLLAVAASLAAGVHAQTATKPVADKPASKSAAKSAQKPAAEEDNPGVRAVERIFGCVADGLPKEWRRAWVIVTELSGDDKERSFEGKFFYSVDAAGAKPVALVPCNAREVAENVYKLNDFLEYEKRSWKVATLIFTSDGKFEIKYDYTK
ncbi:MAG: hypothetical protein ACREVG_08360 [Burkholderiales bacterium]